MTKVLRLTLLAVALAFSTPVQAAELAAYRALYTLEPARIDQATAAAPLDGRIAYEVTGSACAGWTVDTRFATRFADGDKGTRIVDSHSTTFETADGLSLQVNQQQFVNQQKFDDQQISAHRPTPGAEADAQLGGTKSKAFKIGAEMIFPTQHQLKLLQDAADGKSRDVAMVYDGSDADKQFRIVTFIGKKREPGTAPKDQAQDFLKPLSALASWPFQLGYYPVGATQSDTPEFQASFNMYENGITTEMLFDYGTYALKGRIASLELLPPKPCDAAPPKTPDPPQQLQ